MFFEYLICYNKINSKFVEFLNPCDALYEVIDVNLFVKYVYNGGIFRMRRTDITFSLYYF